MPMWISRQQLEVAYVIFIQVQKDEKLDTMPEIMKKGSPKMVLTPAVAAIEHEAAPVWSLNDCAMAVSDVEAEHVLDTFKTQTEAIDWSKKNGHTPHVARVACVSSV
jgi:hypothetical protein